MIVNELLHKRGNPLVGRGDFLVIAAGEHHRNDLVDACWAARETAARILRSDIGAGKRFRLGVLVLHDAAHLERAQLAELLGYSEKRREFGAAFFNAGADIAHGDREIAVEVKLFEITCAVSPSIAWRPQKTRSGLNLATARLKI